MKSNKYTIINRIYKTMPGVSDYFFHILIFINYLSRYFLVQKMGSWGQPHINLGRTEEGADA